LLRSGSLGETVRDKISNSILSAVLRGSDYKTILPFAAQGEVTLRHVEFESNGPGQVSAVSDGELRVSADSAAALNNAFKNGELRMAETKAQSSAH